MRWRQDRERGRGPGISRVLRLIFDEVWGTEWADHDVPDDSDLQKNGVDHVLVHPAKPKPVYVETKVRLRAFPGDALFEWEHIHDNGGVEAGWARKNLRCHYVLFVWFDMAKGGPAHYLVLHWPGPLEPRLQKRYGMVKAQPRGQSYASHNLVIPIRDIRRSTRFFAEGEINV